VYPSKLDVLSGSRRDEGQILAKFVWTGIKVPDLFGGPVVAVVGQGGYMYDAQFRHHSGPPFPLAISTSYTAMYDHKFVPTNPGDSRAPCPALNALANHGYL
jgi:hypothetical protein